MLYLYVSRRLCICIHLQNKNSKKVGTNVSVHAYQRNWIKLPCNLNLKVIFKFYLLLLFHCFRSMPFFDFAIIPHTLRLFCFYCCFCLVCTFGKDLDFYLLTLFFLLFSRCLLTVLPLLLLFVLFFLLLPPLWGQLLLFATFASSCYQTLAAPRSRLHSTFAAATPQQLLPTLRVACPA